MTFENLLDKLWGFDAEVFAHDSLFVFIKYTTKERVVFHNCPANDIQEWLDKEKPILMGFNCNAYDKYILKAWLYGMTPEEIKNVNDYIIGGGKGWEIDMGYISLPIMWDLFNEINPRKSLKEIEGNLRLPITESEVPFDTPTKWTEEQCEDVLYYCTKDVEALFPLFDKLKNNYKSKFIIARFGNIEPAYALSQTNANLTAVLLKAEKKAYDDNFAYVYPSCIDKSKIPKEALDYFDDIIEHNDLEYNPPAPLLHLRDIDFQIGTGGGHAFKKKGTYYYDRSKSKKLLCNWDFTSLYPNLVRLFGYSSRSQSDKDGYVNVLNTRMTAKKGGLSDEFLSPMQLTNKDLNIGLKLPLNAYTGGLRAKFNKLYDNLQGFSICTTGQLIILQLIHDLEQVPTLEMVSANTDAVMFEVDKEYKEQTDKIIHDLEKLTGLEMEEDNIVRIVMANVNNYCELVQIGEDNYAINYKGGQFQCNSIQKNLNLKYDKETKMWETTFTDDVKTNSMTIVGEALLKYLMLDIPVEDTINNCNDIFRFQLISHLGGTYEKCVQESENGDIELQRNNRIYAGLKPSGTIIKCKADGRRDSLANCPPNPIVDNANECSIEDINKEWYIEIAKLRVNDFLGVKRMEEYKKEELVQMAREMGLEFDKKTKKADLIELIKEKRKSVEKNIEKAKVEKEEENIMYDQKDEIKLLKKIQEFRKAVREHEFVLDEGMPDNLGGKDYVNIGQYYNFVQDTCLTIGLDFSFEPVEETRFERDIFKPSVGAPRHLSEVWCRATFTDIETGAQKVYEVLGAGSDSIDKSLSSAETLAFRKWFELNFTPKTKFDWEEEISETETVTENTKTEPKVPAYIPPKVKEEVTEKVVATEQHESSDEDDAEKIAQMVMEIRAAKNDPNYAEAQIELLQKGELQTAEIDAIRVAVENTYFDVVGK